jgi:hypothetical protein
MIDGRSLELQPLSFRLFVELYEHRDEILSAATLTDAVWGKVTVAPDTLKQRVFLLRKALEDAGIDTCTVRSVRGEGYRLIIDESDAPVRPARGKVRSRSAYAGLVAIAIFAIVLWQAHEPYELPANNRVVFWSESPANLRDDAYREWEQRWITRLSSSGDLLFVASTRDYEQTIPAQARQSRAALVSLWTVVQPDGQWRVRMQILEPKTATVLASDGAAIDDPAQMTALIEQQYRALERLLGSGLLPLASDALKDTGNPAWEKLRALAGDPAEPEP